MFEITVRRFYTSDEAPVITPSATTLIRVTHNDADAVTKSCGEVIRDSVLQIANAANDIPFKNVRQMNNMEVDMLLADESAFEEVEGMTRQ